MARDPPNPRVRQLDNQNVSTTAPPARTGLPRHRPLQMRGGPQASSSLAIGLQQQLGAVNAVKWRLVYETRSGQTFRVCDDQPELREIENPDAFGETVFAEHSQSCGNSDVSPECDTNVSSRQNPFQGNERLLGSPRSGRHSGQESQRKKRGHASTKSHVAKRQRSAFQADRAARLHADHSNGSEDDVEDESEDDFAGVTRRATMVRVDQLHQHYFTWFRMIQQMGCKKILQGWLKKCHPRKQASNPYNGGKKARSFADYEHLNRGKNAAPIYWLHQEDWRNPETTGCRHREPDHIKKWERLNLLVHLLRLGRRYEQFPFDIEALEESTKDITERHKEHFHENATEILADIYRARRKEIQYERGEIDGDTMISILIPHQTKGQAPRPVVNAHGTYGKTAASPQLSGVVDVNSCLSTSNSFVTPVANMAVKSEMPPMRSAVNSDAGCATPSSPKTNQLSASAVQTNSATCIPVKDTAIEYQADIDSSSGLTSRSLSQASAGHGLIPLIPTPHAPSVSISEDLETCNARMDASFPKQETTLSRSNHGLPLRSNTTGIFMPNGPRQEGNEFPYINPTETYFPAKMQAHVEVRPTPSRPSYSSSGLEGVLPSTTSATNAYPYLAPYHPPPNNLLPQGATSSRTPVSAGYSPFGVPDFNSTVPLENRNWLFNENWYPTFCDTPLPTNLMAQAYNSNPNPNHALTPQTPFMSMPANNAHGQMLAAQEWNAVAAGNGYGQKSAESQGRR